VNGYTFNYDEEIGNRKSAWIVWIFHAISYGVLILQAVIFVVNDLGHTSFQWFFGLTSMIAVWYFPLIFNRNALWIKNPPRTLAYQIVGWILLGGLIFLNPTAMMLGAMYYPILFTRMPIRWAISSASVLTLGLLVAFIAIFNIDSESLPTIVTVTGLILGGAITIGTFINSLIVQSSDRQRLINELSQTRASLLKVERRLASLQNVNAWHGKFTIRSRRTLPVSSCISPPRNLAALNLRRLIFNRPSRLRVMALMRRGASCGPCDPSNSNIPLWLNPLRNLRRAGRRKTLSA
jgi:hypothetical protein